MLFDLKCNDCGLVEERMIKSSDITGVKCNECNSDNLEKCFNRAPGFNYKTRSFSASQNDSKKDLSEWRNMLDKIAPNSNNRRLL